MIIKKGSFKRISWGAVFAGVLIALVVQMLLSLLGLAIGLGTIDPMTENNPFTGLATGALIWWVVSMLISLFIGGVASGRLSGILTSFDRAIHGFLTFSVYALVSFYLLTTAVGGIISGVGSIVGQTLSLAGKGISAITPEVSEAVAKELKESGVNLENIKEEAKQTLRETGKPELQPENLKKRAQNSGDSLQKSASDPKSVDNIIDNLFAEGKDVVNEVDKEAAVNVVMKRTGKSRQESEQIVDKWIASYHNAKQEFDTLKVKAEHQARETGDAVASGASKASWFAFFGLVLGAAAASAGASTGKPRRRDVVVDSNVETRTDSDVRL